MHIELSEQEQKLFGMLTTLPPSFESAAHFLATEKFTSDEVTRVAIEYVDECFCEVSDLTLINATPRSKEVVPDLHSTYIVDVIKFLLPHGMDPNGIHEDCNIMDGLKYVDNEFLAADAMALLLEHGGNVNLVIDGEELFRSINFDIFFDAVEQYDRHHYASLVHLWMVLIGYGARMDTKAFRVFKEFDSAEYFDLNKLKKHRNYYFGLSRPEKYLIVHIFDKDTLWEVARTE